MLLAIRQEIPGKLLIYMMISKRKSCFSRSSVNIIAKILHKLLKIMSSITTPESSEKNEGINWKRIEALMKTVKMSRDFSQFFLFRFEL
jgi:hypothetical protein